MSLHNISQLPTITNHFKTFADVEDYFNKLRRGIINWTATLPEHVDIVTLGLTTLSDPNDDRIVFWDDSAGKLAFLDIGPSLAITTTTLDTIQDIRTTASPTWAGLDINGVIDQDVESATAAGDETALSVLFNHNKTTAGGGNTLDGLKVITQTPAGNDVNTDDILYGAQITARHYGDGTITGLYGGRFVASNIASTAAGEITGLFGLANSQFGDSANINGLNFGVTIENYSGAAISSDYLTGAYISLALNASGVGSSATVTDIRGFVAEPAFTVEDSGTVTATNYYGFLSKNFTAYAGSISLTNQYGVYIEEPTIATNKWAIYAVGGLTHLGGNLEVGAYGYFGVNDTTRGIVTAYGPATGGDFGGTFVAHTGADHDTTIGNYGFMVWQDDLFIGPDTNTDALKLDALDDFYITGGSIILPASEYVNLGGTQGSGGYGLRDNAGAVEYKDSGGAWTAINSLGGGGAPTDAQYVVLAANGTLSAERILTAGDGIAPLVDAGAGSTVTVSTKSLNRHVAEIFDGLATGAINGLGSYYQCGAWTDASAATCTTTVAVKAGADKMLRTFAPAGAGSAVAGLTLSSTIGLSGGCRVRWKMRTDQAAANYSGGLLIANAGGTTVASCRFRNATTYKIQFYDGTTYTDLVNPAAANTWYTIDMFITDQSSTTGTARIWVDGTYIASPATATHAAEWDTIKCYCTNAGAADLNVDYDDIQIYSLMPLFTEL